MDISLTKSNSGPKESRFSFKTFEPLPVKYKLNFEFETLFVTKEQLLNNNSIISSNLEFIIFLNETK